MAVNLFDLYAKISLDDTQFNAGIGKALASGNTLAAKIGSVFTGISNVGKTAFKAVGAAVATGTAALGAFVKSSVDTGMTFDKAMSQVAATMGYSTDELNTKGSEANQTFERLREAAMHYGETTAFTSTQAAEALNYMALAGYDAETSIAMLPNVLNLAAAGGLELGYASDMITDSQTALGLTLDETNVLMDQMAMAASKSNTSVGQLGEAILTVGGTAKYMSGGTEELSSVIGVLADNGIKGSEAGTHLRNIILKLASPTEAGAAALDKLGVSVFDSEGKMRSFSEIFPELNAAMANLTEEQKLQALSDIFNVRDIASVNALLGTTSQRWDELGGYIENAGGSMAQMAATQLDNLAGDITILNSAMDGLKIAISDRVTPALRQFVQYGTESIGQVKAAFTSGGWEAAINVVSQVLAQMLNQFIAFIPQIASMATQFVSTFVSNIGSNIGSITTAANQILQAFISGFGQIMTQLMPIISQLVPTIANYILTYKTQMFTLGLQIITAIAQGIANNIGTMIKSAQGILQNFVGAISQYAPQLISAAGQIIIALGNGIAQGLPRLVQYAGQLIATLANGISAAIPKLIPVIQKIIDSIGKSLGDTSTISKITSAAANLIMTLAEGLSKAMPNIFNAAVNIISGLLRGLTSGDSLGKIISAGLKLLDSIVQGISNAIPKLIPVAADVIGRLTGTLVAKLPEILLTGVKILESLINGIIKAIPELVAAIPRIILGFVNGVTANLGTVVKEGIQLIVKLAAGVVEGIVHLVATAPKIVISLVKAIIQLVPELGKAGLELIKGLWEGIKGAGAWLWDKVKGFFGGIVDKIKGFLGIHSPSTLFAGFGRNMALGLGKGWDDEYDRIRDDIQSGLDFEPANISTAGSYGRIGTSNMGTASDSSDTETVTEYNMQVTINLNGSDYTSQRQIAEEISVQLQNLVNRRSAAWA